MRLTTYDKALILNADPHGCSVVAAPPTLARRSRTVTRAPRRESRPAATRPLWPPPTTTTSNPVLVVTLRATPTSRSTNPGPEPERSDPWRARRPGAGRESPRGRGRRRARRG